MKRCVKANVPGHGQQGSVDIQGGSRQRSKHLYLDPPCKDCVTTGCLWASLNLGFLRWNPGSVIWIKEQGDDSIAKSSAHAWHTAHGSCHGHVITGSFKILGRRHHIDFTTACLSPGLPTLGELRMALWADMIPWNICYEPLGAWL